MTMRIVSNRFLPLAGRYGIVLFAALVVYYIIRAPVLTAVANFSMPNDLRQDMHIKEVHSEEDALIIEDLESEEQPLDIDEQQESVVKLDVPDPLLQPPPAQKVYKPRLPQYHPIGDHFPWLTHSQEPPPVVENNWPPWPHVPEKTPLLIGFTRNWPLLLQCVSSYIAAGWPPSDIFVVENTGTAFT